jgi:hypothetical protein
MWLNLKTTPCHIAFPGLFPPQQFLPKSEPVPQEHLLVFELAFSHSFCLRDVAWFHLAYVWTRHGDVGTTRTTVRVRQEPSPDQSKYRFASLEHHPPDYRSIMQRLVSASLQERGSPARVRRPRWKRLEYGTSSRSEQTCLHGEPCCAFRLRWSMRRGDAFGIFVCRRRGNRPILCFKSHEHRHLTGVHSLSGPQFISSEIIALPNLLLDGALNIRERELRIAPARRRERVTQEA